MRENKEIAVEVTDQAGLAYTETFEIRMEERPTEPSQPSEPTPSSINVASMKQIPLLSRNAFNSLKARLPTLEYPA